MRTLRIGAAGKSIAPTLLMNRVSCISILEIWPTTVSSFCERIKPAKFACVFEAVETMHLEGDDYVREDATIGALEGIQNIAGNSFVDPEQFLPFSRKTSMKHWERLNQFWSGKRRTI